MPPKNASSNKTVAKKGKKPAPVESKETSTFEYESLFESSGEKNDGTSTTKAVKKGKELVKDKGKKVVPQECKSPPRGDR